MTEKLALDWLLDRPGEQPGRRGAEILLQEDRIAEVRTVPQSGNGLIALPGLSNAHDHARGVSSTALGAFDRPLESWLFYLGVIPSIDPYLIAASSLARSALRGAGRVMVHYTRTQGLTDLVSEAQEVKRAAMDVGVHVGFAVSMKDRNPVAYADSDLALHGLPEEMRAEVASRLAKPAPSVSEQLALADEIAAGCHGPGFNVQYGPNGVQWCSDNLLQAIADASAQNGRQVHMHLLETRYQREWADHHYPQGIVHYLAYIGLLSPRLTLAHCTHCRPDELELIAQSGATIAVNTSSNLGLRSGMAPVAGMLKAGCRVAMGIDGLALDEDDDALRELRLLYHLHKGTGYDVSVSPAQAWRLASLYGRHAVSGVSGEGMIGPGEEADILVLDGKALMEDRLFEDVDVYDFVLGRASANHIRQVIVAGRTIVRDGSVMGVDYPALRAEVLGRLRSRMKDFEGWRTTVKALDKQLASLYQQGGCLGCC